MDGNGTEMAQNPMNKTEESTQSAVQPKQYHRSSFHQKKHSYRKQVEELIESSKNKLLPWAKLSMEEQEKNGSDMFGDLGGCEGLPVLLMIASLDEDGDGDLGVSFILVLMHPVDPIAVLVETLKNFPRSL